MARVGLHLAVPMAALLVGLVAPSAWAQEGGSPRYVEVRRDVRYEITTRSDVLVGTDSGPGMILTATDWAKVAPDGRIFVLEFAGPSISVFEPDGRYVGRVGGEGQGPEEFRFVMSLLFSRDSAYVLDVANARLSVVDADLRVIRTAPLTMVPSSEAEFIDDSLIVMNAHTASRDDVGHPLQVMDTRGRRVARLASEGIAYNGALMDHGSRRVSVGPGGTIWAARTDEYLIDEWALDDRHLTRLSYRPDAFPRKSPPRTRDDPPPPTLLALDVDAEGLIWVVMGLADPRWASAWNEGTTHYDARIDDYNLYYDSVIQVIDPTTGTLVAERKEDPFLFFGASRTVTSVEGSVTSPRLRVRRLALSPIR